MFHLLSSTSIFLDVGNGSFCQATGRPIHELKPLNTQHGRGTKRLLPSDMIQDERASKRRRAEGIQSLDKPAEYDNQPCSFKALTGLKKEHHFRNQLNERSYLLCKA